MKKIISLFLALALVICAMPMAAFAAGATTISFETTFEETMTVGDTFTVTANLANNPTFGTLTLSLKWNEDVVRFTGFSKNARGSLVSDVLIYGIVVTDDTTGVATCADTIGYDTNGVIYTANFEIIGSGDLGLGIKDADATEFEMAAVDATDIDVTVDTSALSGLSVAAPSTGGVTIPDGAPFTAITTDAGDVIAIEEQDDVNGVPYYIVTIPEDAETAYVTAPDQVVMEDWTTGAMQATAYAFEVDNGWNQLFISYNYEDSEAGPIVEIPMYMVASDWSGEVELCFVEDEDGYLTHAFGIEDASYACLGIISFRYGTAPEGGEEDPTYKITVQQTTGGTVTIYNEVGEEITEAAADEYVLVQVDVATGYKFKYVTVNGEPTNLENGFFKMPAEDVIVSAVFEEVHICEYKEVAAEAFLKQEATCQSGAVYYKSCECGGKSEQTFISGDPVACVYVDGICKWCGAAEPVVTPGFRFATSADVSAENGGTAVVKVMITGHSDPNVTKYNAYDITLTYDNDKLEYQDYAGAVLSDNGRVEVDEENGTIRIVGCGADKDFGTEIAALTFKTKAEGEATVTIDKVQVSDKNESVKEDAPEATPKHEEEDPDADETPGVSVVVVPYSVTKPDFISGNDKILHGEDYTFSYTDTTNYTYSDLTVTMGGVAVENLTADENGVYTIANVTGAIEITATQTPNSYDVTKPENVTGDDKATYGTPYVFTVTPSKEDMAIDTVTVKYADGSEVPYKVNENGEYVIAGTDITGAFTITVTEKEKMTTITFSGIEEDEIDGGKLTMAAEIGKNFTFKLIKKEGFDYTVKVGETELTESTETEGQYTIPAELVVKGGVTVAIEKVDNTTATVDVVEYINLNGKTMFLVTAKWGEKVLAYGEEGTMFWSSKYTVTGEDEAGAYCWLVLSTEEMKTVDQVKAAAEDAIVEAAEGVTATAIGYDYDINETTKVDVNDAQLAYDMYNASYMEFTENLPMLKFLEADMSTDMKLDTQDVAAIINYIVNGANA